MTISTTKNVVVVQGNNVGVTFNYDYQMDDEHYAVLIYTDTSGVSSVVAPGSYVVNDVHSPTGGTFKYQPNGVPLVVGATLTLARVVPYTQGRTIANQGNFYPQVIESALDFLTMQTQQLANSIGRSPLLPITVDLTTFETEMLEPVPGAVIRVKNDGSGFEWGLAPAAIGASAFGLTLVAAVSRTAARSILGAGVWCGTAGGTANAITLTPATAITSYLTGDYYIWKSGAAGNSGATTIAISGLGALAVQFNGAACVGGEIEASKWYISMYDGAALQTQSFGRDAYQLLAQMTKPVRTTDFMPLYDVAAKSYKRVLLDDLPLPPYHISGMEISNNAGDAINDIDITAGSRRSATNTDNIILAAAMTKQLDAAWAVGTNQGMRASGAAIADTTYHIFVIKRPDTGVVDLAADTSATGANIAANTNAAYTEKRRIGSIIRSGGAIVACVWLSGNIEVYRKTPVVTRDDVNPGTAAVSRALDTPNGIVTIADIWLGFYSATTSGGNTTATALDQDDPTVPAATTAALAGVVTGIANIGGPVWSGARHRVATDTSRQIRVKTSSSGAADRVGVITHGWTDIGLLKGI